MASGDDSVARSSVLLSPLSCRNQLSPEWKAAATTDQRIYFVNQRTRSTHWFPPPEFWVTKLGLPYGWEAALDSQNKRYYINHVTRTTTREDPRSEADQATHLHMTPSQARRIELVRDATIGFGFVAGSEKPVVIRSVMPNGPSYDKLFANDQILKVNGKDVRDAPQAEVISLIKGVSGRIELEVVASEDVQDTKNQRNRKSSLMSRTTRQRRRSTPVSVRFADEPALVQVIGPMEPVRRSSVPLIPNVLKVFLENDQTRSFRYDSNTTAEEIFQSFASKLDVRLMEHFSLVLSGPKKGQISYIQNHERVSEIYTNRNCSSVNCLCKLNIAFVPRDHFELLSQDPNAFEYLYSQVTNMVVEGFYGMDLKYDLAIKLAALQIQQKAVEAAAGRPIKMSVRQIEKEFGGLRKFVSSDLLHNMREKELRKVLDQQIKQNENLASPGARHMSSLQCKIHYLNLAAEIFSYGGRYFDVELVDRGSDGPNLKKTKKQYVTVLVSLKYAVSQVVRGKVNVLCQLADFHEITGFKISRCEDNKKLLRIWLEEGKKIGFICTSLDCLDMVALITGYYKVYVDNTSNTPLPVENDEQWPFSFRRDPPTNDAPDFYSRHQVVPDVWSYPSLFRSSSPNRERKAENTKPLNGHKEVFIDLSRAPPRFHETVISEESEEEHMAKADWKTLDQNLEKRKDLGPQNDQHGDETGAISIEQYDTPELVTSQDDEDLLEEVSAVSKDVTEDTESVNSEMPSEISNGGETFSGKEELTASGEQGRASLENSWKENVETNSTDTGAPDQDDLIAELLLVEELVQNERASTVECDKNEVKENSTLPEKDSLSSISTDGSDSWVALKVENDELKTQANSVVDEQKGIDFELDAPGQLSSENVVSSFEQAKGEVDTSVYVDSVAFAQAGADYTGIVINNAHEQSSPQEEGSSDSQPTVSDEQTNLHLARQHDPFITVDPFLDRSPTPSLSDLGYDETKFNNMEIELVEYVEGWTALEGSDGQESKPSLTEKRPYLEIKGDDPNNNQSEDLQLTGYPDFNSDTISIPDDVHEFKRVFLSDMMSEGFAESNETETASEMSEDESLWSTFPEFFQPSRRVKYSGNNQGVLLLAEEDQNDSDALDCTETVQDLTLVRLKEFHSKGDLQQVNSNDFVDTGPRQKEAFDEKDLEEFSTASSESFECTYEVNAEFTSEEEMMCGDDDYGHLKEKKEVEKQEIPEHEDESTDLSLDVYLVSSDTTVSDKRDVCLDTCSNLDTEGLKVDEPTQLFSFQKTASFSPCHGMDFTEKKNIANTRIGVSSEKPTTPPELSPPTIGNGTLGNNEIVSQGFRSSSESGNEVNHVWNDLDRSYSPSNWIIPSPPTPTAELQEHDIPIVSPPPIHRTSSEAELDEEFKNLILPSPPSLTDTFQTISNIRIVPPPPPPTVDINRNEVGDLIMYDYDEIRFLSLTDDHKLAHNNGCVSNFTGDKEIQDQNFATDASSVSMDKDSTSKSVTIPHRHGITNRTETNLKQNSTRYVPVGRFIDSDTSLSGLSTSQGSRSTWQQFVKLEGVFQEFPNTEAVSSPDFSNVGENRDRNIRPHRATELNPAISSADQENVSFDSRSRSTLKQKPYVPAKTWAARTAKSATREDRAEESSTTPKKGVRASTSDSSLDMIEGNKKTIASTANTHEKSLNPELAEAGLSTLRSQPQYWDTLKDSSNNPPSIAGTPSQLNAPNSSITGVKEPELRESANSSNLSAEPFMEFASVSSITPNNTRLPETFKGKISQEPEALRPVLSNIDKQETLSSYQVGYSPSTAAEDILVRDEFNTKNINREMGRRLSFTYRSAYVPAPYSPTRSATQSLYTTQSSVENVHESSFYTSRLSPVESAVTHSGTQGTYSQLPCNTKPCLIPTSLPVVTSSSIENNADYPVNNALFCLQRPLLTRLHRDSDGNPALNPDKDDNYRVLPEESSGSSNFQFSTDLSDSKSTKKECSHTIELHKDVCTNASPSSTPPPLPDSSPPPLPGTSPPRMIPVFDDNDFDFGEPLTDSYQDNAQNESPERTPLDIPSSAKVLKSRRSSASVSRQGDNSSDYIYGMEGKDYSRNSLSRSLTLTSFSQGINRRSSNENTRSYENPSKTGRSNLGDITDAIFHSMDGVETKSLGIKCFNVCEESLSKVSDFRKRLEVHMNGSASRANISNETKNWPLVLQNNARFLACDVKVISSSIKRGGAQVLAAIRASLDSLEKLVESCEQASETLSKSSTDGVRTLVSMVIEVLEHYCDVIATVKTASVERPDAQNVETLVEKTSAMSLLITSLIRTLRKY